MGRLREYDSAADAGEDIEPFDQDHGAALPATDNLWTAAMTWTQARGAGRVNFYSAREEPDGGASPAKAKAATKKAASKKITNAALAEQVASLAEVKALAALETPAASACDV